MCMIDDADGYNLCTSPSIWRKARKQHRCDECFRMIAPGEAYQYDSGIGPDRDPFSHKTCGHCQIIMKWLQENCSGYLHTTIVDDITEHASDYRQLGLYRLVIGARRKWARRKGGLMKIPAVPPNLEPKSNTRGMGHQWA